MPIGTVLVGTVIGTVLGLEQDSLHYSAVQCNLTICANDTYIGIKISLTV